MASTPSISSAALLSCRLPSPSSSSSVCSSSSRTVASAFPSVHRNCSSNACSTSLRRGSLDSRPRCYRRIRWSPRSMAPDEEKMTRRSPLDFPIEWERPRPGRRPDIFPQFSPMKTPLPQPPPTDPPEEDEEEEEKKEEEEKPEEEPEAPPKET